MDEIAAQAEIRYADAASLPDALVGADALFVWDFLSDAVTAAWPRADRLRWIHVASAGVDRLLIPSVVASPVVLTNSSGVFDRSVAEYILASVFAATKRIPESVALQRRREWKHREVERVSGKRVLVVGTGGIGRAAARLLSAVGAVVIGVGSTERTGDPDFGAIHSSDRLQELVQDADFVALAVPLTPKTRGLVDTALLARMKPSAWLINVARGAVVDEAALVDALRRGALSGAFLDVFAEEPLPQGSPLWDMENVVVSAHMCGDFVGWLPALADLFVENFRRWSNGEPLLSVVDKERGYGSGRTG
jgi:phosphoglycerate dehydrogenase-like enzyme